MESIEAVIVDFGGVLAEPPTEEAFARLAAVVGLENDGLAEAWLRHRLSYDLGELDAPEYWRLVAGRVYELAVLEAVLAEDARCWSVPNAAMVGWLHALYRERIRVALL